MRLTWVQPEDLLLHAFVQAHDEGLEVGALEAAWVAAGGTLVAPVSGAAELPAAPETRTLARRLLDELDRLSRRATAPLPGPPDSLPGHPDSALRDPDSAVDHPDSLLRHPREGGDLPSGWDDIWPHATPEPALPTETSFDRLHGAWLGRAAGCLLGKPVEKIPRAGIRAILTDTGDWPLTRYFTAAGLSPEVAERYPWNRRSRPTSLRENIAGMPEDDDLNYPLLNLDLLERLGDRFTVDDVAESWLANLPAGRVFTAERIAYRNLLLGIEPALAGSTGNPFKEWIGAWIRGDVFGWTHPGRPREAALPAFADARLSHVRNGLYGELWVAGACAAAVVADDLETVLAAGASVVPADSLLAEAIADGVRIARDRDLNSGLDALHERYGRYHWVHVLNNAATVAWALASTTGTDGRPDFGAAICRAVMAGWDTDSAAATVGSIAGGLLGAAALPQAWIAPLQDRYATSLPGQDGVSFTDLAERTLALARSRS